MVERQQEESQPRDSLNNLSHFSAHLHFAQKHVEHILIIIPEPSRTSIFRFSVLERPVHTESHDQISLYIQTSSYILTSLERDWKVDLHRVGYVTGEYSQIDFLRLGDQA